MKTKIITKIFKSGVIKRFQKVLPFCLTLCLIFMPAFAANSRENDSHFLYAMDASGDAWSFAVAVNITDKTLVFTDSSKADNYPDGEALLEIDEAAEPLYREEGNIFSNGNLFSWHTESRVSSSAVLSAAQPVGGESVSVFYIEEDQTFAKTDTAIKEIKIYEDGTGSVSLNENVSGMSHCPGYVLNSVGDCVGVLYNSGAAYTPWYGVNTVIPDLPDIPEPEPKPFWQTTAGVAGITAVIVAAAAFVILKKSKPSKPANLSRISSDNQSDIGGTEYYAGPVHAKTDLGGTEYYIEKTDDFQKTVPVETPSRGLAFKGGIMNGVLVPLNAGTTTIGRDPSCTVHYPIDPRKSLGISQNHALIRVEGDKITLCDTSSTGTYLKRIGRLSRNQPVQVNVGDVFCLGGEDANRVEIISI